MAHETTKDMQTKDELQRQYDILSVINLLLRLSLADMPIEEILGHALELILSIPWLSLESKGSVFLVEDDPETLVMKAQNGLAEPVQKACARIPFGKCMCGRAALTQEIQFADGIDHRHEIRYDGIVPHGHYSVPILYADTTLGVINLYLEEGRQRNQDEEEFLTVVANTLAGIIIRRQAEDELQQKYDILSVINSLLRLSLADMPIEEILDHTLELILSIPWLSLESKGSMFLVEDDPETLVMKAQNGLAEPVQKACARIPFGKCICGQAALTQEIQFADGIDDRHEIRYDGIAPHGHYSVPILYADTTLGVINLYLAEGRQRSQDEEEFLTAVANTLAGIIIRRQANLISQQLMEDNVRMQEEIKLTEDTTHVVSHELKSPLSTIASLAMAVLEPSVSIEDKERLLIRIVSRARSARVMIEEHLQLFAISAGQLDVILKKVNLRNEAIKDVLDDQKELMTDKQITAKVNVPHDLEVLCDPKYARIVYNNLVSNAAKYGTKNSEIYLGYDRCQDGFHCFNVASEGELIEESDRERVFEKYVRLGRPGTGIGLHAAREIVREHGGDIWVEPCHFVKGKYKSGNLVTEEHAASEESSTGNNFVFTIPIHSTDA